MKNILWVEDDEQFARTLRSSLNDKMFDYKISELKSLDKRENQYPAYNLQGWKNKET
jgi:ActR/RegA family two-component response regulator